GQRLQRIDAALRSGLATQIEKIVLHDEQEALPLGWRNVLAHFECELEQGVAPAAHAAPDTDLGRIQRLLLELDDDAAGSATASGADDGGARRERVPLRGDDSLIVLRGASRDVSAQVIGEYLRGTGP